MTPTAPLAATLVVPSLLLAGCRAEPTDAPASGEPAAAAPGPAGRDDSGRTASLPPLGAPPPSAAADDHTPLERDRRGDAWLLAGRFDEAVAAFDAYLEAVPEAEPYHWRRGIALYYAGEYARGAEQFVVHRTVNPADVENAVWHFLCTARAEGVEAARAALLPVGRDGRVPMPTVYRLFAGDAGPGDVLDEAESAATRGDPTARFYAHLYLGLYHEALGDRAAARHHIDLAAGRHWVPGYMGGIARVHAHVLARTE